MEPCMTLRFRGWWYHAWLTVHTKLGNHYELRKKKKKQPCFTLWRIIRVLSDTILPAPFFEVYFEKLFLKVHQIVELNFHIKFHLICFWRFGHAFIYFSLKLKHGFYLQEGYGSLNGLKNKTILFDLSRNVKWNQRQEAGVTLLSWSQASSSERSCCSIHVLV